MPTLFPATDETIVGVGQALRAGRMGCVDVLEHCLARIEEWEPRVHAWVVVDRDGAYEQARKLDEELAVGQCRGPLHGIPFGIKDIIDVKALPTACGFGPWKDRVPVDDAACVAALRQSGAVILGKTVTTQFAWIDPPVTRNPWNFDRTPGGSSSGSAAAVATGMCLAALGTQTGGSVTRPAAFCGVASLKLGNDDSWLRGILPFAPTLDHLGIFTRTVEDLRIFSAWTLHGYPIVLNNDAADTVAKAAAPPQPNHQWIFGRPRGYFDRRAETETLAAFEEALKTLQDAGAQIVEWDDSAVDFDGMVGRHRTVMAAEAAAGHEGLFRESGQDYAPHIRQLVEEGLSMPATRYVHARYALEGQRPRVTEELFVRRGGPVALVVPATIGPAPDVSTTGNPCMNSPWSYLGLPVVSLPTGLAGDRLPLSLQLVGSQDDVSDLVSAAAWCESVIRRAAGAGSV